MSRCVDPMNLEKTKGLIIWNRGVLRRRIYGSFFFLYTNHPRAIVELHVLINLPSRVLVTFVDFVAVVELHVEL